MIHTEVASEGVVWEIRELLVNQPSGVVLHVSDDPLVCPALSMALQSTKAEGRSILWTNTVSVPNSVVGILEGGDLPSCIVSRSPAEFAGDRKGG